MKPMTCVMFARRDSTRLLVAEPASCTELPYSGKIVRDSHHSATHLKRMEALPVH